jgi:thioredoxin 1
MAVSGAEFESDVLQSQIPVLVDFWAEWCPPCKRLGPELDGLASELDGKLKVVKVDVDAEPDLAANYSITSIPALLLFKDGKLAEQFGGFMPKQMLAAKVNPHL